MTTAELLNDLTLRCRGCNLLYALGDYTSSNVPTFAPGEAGKLVLAAHEAMHGDRSTPLHRRIAELAPGVVEYAATGRIREQEAQS